MLALSINIDANFHQQFNCIYIPSNCCDVYRSTTKRPFDLRIHRINTNKFRQVGNFSQIIIYSFSLLFSTAILRNPFSEFLNSFF